MIPHVPSAGRKEKNSARHGMLLGGNAMTQRKTEGLRGGASSEQRLDSGAKWSKLRLFYPTRVHGARHSHNNILALWLK